MLKYLLEVLLWISVELKVLFSSIRASECAGRDKERKAVNSLNFGAFKDNTHTANIVIYRELKEIFGDFLSLDYSILGDVGFAVSKSYSISNTFSSMAHNLSVTCSKRSEKDGVVSLTTKSEFGGYEYNVRSAYDALESMGVRINPEFIKISQGNCIESNIRLADNIADMDLNSTPYIVLGTVAPYTTSDDRALHCWLECGDMAIDVASNIAMDKSQYYNLMNINEQKNVINNPILSRVDASRISYIAEATKCDTSTDDLAALLITHPCNLVQDSAQ